MRYFVVRRSISFIQMISNTSRKLCNYFPLSCFFTDTIYFKFDIIFKNLLLYISPKKMKPLNQWFRPNIHQNSNSWPLRKGCLTRGLYNLSGKKFSIMAPLGVWTKGRGVPIFGQYGQYVKRKVPKKVFFKILFCTYFFISFLHSSTKIPYNLPYEFIYRKWVQKSKSYHYYNTQFTDWINQLDTN